jgi:hypothetical protein
MRLSLPAMAVAVAIVEPTVLPNREIRSLAFRSLAIGPR